MRILQVLPALEQGGSEWDAVELALALRAAAIRSVAEKFSSEITVRKTLALYREILNSPKEDPSRIGRIPILGLAVLALCVVLGLDRVMSGRHL